MAQITLNNVTKYYGSDLVVKEVNLKIEDGEFVALLGPSGCGKTTTLRMIAGLEKLSSGELSYDGHLVNDQPAEDRNVGMVFQTYALYPHMNVYENLSFGLRSRKVPKSQVRERVEKVAALLELSQLLKHKPKELSGGQRQRVALGRAIVGQPKVFLMDEPLSNLDANLRDRMRAELAKLHSRLAITTVYVTHDQGEALTLADRIVVMNKGRVHQIGTPHEIYSYPVDTFVASFIGSPGMNLWTLPWARQTNCITSGNSLRLPRSFESVLESTSETATFGIRPEHLSVSEPNEEEIEIFCKAEVVEHFGSHVMLHGRLESEGEPLLVARLDPDAVINRGQKVRLSAPIGALHIFDSVTSERLPAKELVLI